MENKNKANSVVEGTKCHSSPNTIYHALYGYYFLNLKRTQLAQIYNKTLPTISNWIEKFEKEGCVGRKKQLKIIYKKFGHLKRQWLLNLYVKEPILYLSEAQEKFKRKFKETISASSVSLILHEAGLTWKVIERRALQIKLKDVLRFCDEMTQINWSYENLVFLDEVSFNGQDMLRKNGYGTRGESLVFRGEFVRTARTSLLCFIGVNGLLDAFETDGTFTRKKFAQFCRQLALENIEVKTYPGPNSVWLMDGAKIHCSDKLIYYLRSLGIIPVFLPAYCPVLNPIELVFGNMKSEMRKKYKENSKIDKKILICEVLNKFKNRNMERIFRKCGYFSNGKFDPSEVLKMDLTKFEFN